MHVITLIPKSKQGKQLVKAHGDRWEVLEQREYVLFSDRAGPWLLAVALQEDRAPANDMRAARIDSSSRWIHMHDDEHFKTAP